MPQKRPTTGVKGDPASPPVEEWHSQLRLKSRDCLAERRLRNPEFLGCPRHVFEPGERLEIVQLE